ncbi:hypothetical protein GJW-30_1_01973 [Variibacter gotjawalensis]|uniref:Uncharacterized protein n=1 Tax=Variibacter gotjawalensis TaxID=1333996 RepID=A0A0S3PUD4_9BRAD|nr:DUF4286 family protein [Variibacter gotjawalensis]NIK49762.1 hypothetical protein [Variibacter gotjawalensis]RZS45767.1 hypothetical protein EV661_4091 [Variibacter gotjawalensis]BAT59440.1 hypothetical protein GJW-30_1_01973 [Variibacter gotjawalensis]
MRLTSDVPHIGWPRTSKAGTFRINNGRWGGPVQSYFYLVFTRAKPGQDEAFNAWYSDRHIYDLIAIPGIRAAQRFALLDLTTGQPTPDYLAVYEFDDLERAIGGIAERRGTDKMPSTDAIDRSVSRGVVFRPTWPLAVSWRFDRGTLDLVKPQQALSTELAGVEGLLVAHDRQSRPGPTPYDLAFFARGDDAGRPKSWEAVAKDAADRMTAAMKPITERVASKTERA